MFRSMAVMLFAAMLSINTRAEGAMSVALRSNDVGTLHLHGQLGTNHHVEFLLDTGSAYVVLSETTRRELERAGMLTPLRHLRALMANNASVRAQLFRVSELTLSSGCVLRNFEAVALPGAHKNILGLSALRSVAPFTIHLAPARLELSCSAMPPAGDVIAMAGPGADP